MFIIPSLELTHVTGPADTAGIAETINAWDRDGFHRVELVYRSRDRGPLDLRIVENVLRDAQPVLQIAGGNESEDEIDATLGAGASFGVLGPRSLDDPDWLFSIVSRFPDQLLVTTPARERRTRSRGVVRTLPLDLRDLASELSDTRLAGLVIEFAPDSGIAHPEFALLEDVVEDVPYPVMVSGGSPDLGTLRDLEFRGIAATIISAAHLAEAFDGQGIARSFAD
jgi:phosphoribosylformimino-5-aminoimidazole carboxamide ribonucleotide (ProFAR) isomerase